MLPEGRENYYGNLPRELRELTLDNFVSISIIRYPYVDLRGDHILIRIEVSLGNKVIFTFQESKRPLKRGKYIGFLLDGFLMNIEGGKSPIKSLDSFYSLDTQLIYKEGKFSIITRSENPEFNQIARVSEEVPENIPEEIDVPIVEIDKKLSDILLEKLKLVNEDLKSGKFINV